MYNNTFYQNLKKPDITPKPIVFKYVWITLYLMMFAALYLVIRKPDSAYKIWGLMFFAIQFLLNIVWSPVFFVLQNMKLSYVVSILMTVFTALTIFIFSKVSVSSALLLVPYLIWSAFACFLIRQFIKINSE
ncbi:MAG: tryptophan-rich sensory protein [Candidatus Gastranaerophilales bacterium]|nr:tryptophan-rich sensory protein [Candidatus Gastranaerophilales bacterium]